MSQPGGRASRILKGLSKPPQRTWPDGVIHHGARLALLGALALMLAVSFPPNPRATSVDRYEIGMLVEGDVFAEVPFSVPKTPAELERDRESAAAAVPITYRYRPEAGDSTAAALNRFFVTLEGAALGEVAELESVLASENIAAGPSQLETLRDSVTLELIHRAALRAARELIPPGVIDAPDRGLLGGRITVLGETGERFVGAESLLTATDFYNRSTDLLPPSASPEIAEILRLLLIRFREFSYAPDLSATEVNRNRFRQSVATTKASVLAGEAIVRANQQFTQEDLERLQAYEERLRGLDPDPGPAGGFLPSLGVFLLQLLLLGMFGLVLWMFRGEVYANFRWVLLIALLIGAYFGVAVVISRVDVFPDELLPIAFVTLSVAVIWDSRLAFILALTLGVVSGSLTPFLSFDVLATTLVGGGAAALSVRVVRRRSQSWTFIAIIAASYAAVILALGLIQLRAPANVLPSIGWTAGNAIVSAGLAMLFVPAFEWFTRITTDQTLLEFADPNRNLLKRLSLEAPGTYAHTINVANLAEAAGNAIGANGLLCRVGIYYHDIGKMLKPQYFIENQPEGRNPHDKLKPATSAGIVRDHVIEGLRLAREDRLPTAISDFIPEHHGTQRIGFFYDKALEEAGTEELDEAEFSYPGPKPRSKETAVALLADPVESAARALRDPTAERIRGLIDGIVDSKIHDGQLDEAPLTFAELSLIKQQFEKVLGAMYHHRIDYPATKHLTGSPSKEEPAQHDGADGESARDVGDEPNEAATTGSGATPTSGAPAS